MGGAFISSVFLLILSTQILSPELSMFVLSGFGTSASNGEMTLGDAFTRSQGVQKYIMGGQEVTESYGFMAVLQQNGFAFSGGSLISPSVVLASASSTENFSPTHVLVNCKSGFYDNQEQGCEQIEVKSFQIHPEFSLETGKHDVMLVILKTKAKATPVSLFGHEMETNSPVTALGYGLQGNTGRKILKEAQMYIDDRESCNKQYRMALAALFKIDLEKIDKDLICMSMVCAQGKSGTGMSGDRGGPLFKSCNNKHLQVGVSSFSLRQIFPELPDVFANLAHEDISSFLKNVVANQGETLDFDSC